jgi:hypothetical protein
VLGLAIAPLGCFGQVGPHYADSLSVSFEENRGQFEPYARYVARMGATTVLLTETGLIFHSRSGELRLNIENGRKPDAVEGLEPTGGTANYFGDTAKFTGIPNYAAVRYRSIYPGIDMVLRCDGRKLEYDFVIAPGADPSAIEMGFPAAQYVKISPSGDLAVGFGDAEVVHRKPVVYQVQAGNRVEVAGRFTLRERSRVAFEIGAYDRTGELVIDPVLSYSALIGGSNVDVASGMALDSAGNAYVTGYTYSSDFPWVAGSLRNTFNGSAAFVYKMDPSGTTLIYSALISGASGNAIALDSQGNAYVAGSINGDVSLFKLNSAGSALTYRFVFGGSYLDAAYAIAVDSGGNAFVAGSTSSPNFPTTSGVFQASTSSSGTCFIAKVDPTGTTLLAATFLGGNGSYTVDVANAIALDGSGNVYVAGNTTSSDFPVVSGSFQTDGSLAGLEYGFVSKLSPNLSGLVYSTFIPGGGVSGNGIAVDSAGSAYVAGSSTYLSLPDVPGPTGMFILKLNPAGTASTYLTTPGPGSGNAIATDLAGNAYITGWTSSSSFTLVAPIQAIPGLTDNQTKNVVLMALNATGGVTFSSYLGGKNDGDTGYAVAVGSNGMVYFAGRAGSIQFPVTPGAAGKASGDGFNTFVAAVNLSSSCTFSLSSSASVAAAGGSGSVNITTQPSCDWIAVSNQPWLTITGGSSGSGSGVVDYTIAASTVPARSAPLSAGGVVSTISQADGCTFSLSSNSIHVRSAGSVIQVSLTTGEGCTYTASTPPAWVELDGGPPYNGSTQWAFTVTANTGTAPRSATLTLAGQPFVINEDGGYTCSFALGPNGNFSSGATLGSVEMTTSNTCSWSAVSNASWLHVTLIASGSGNDPLFGTGSGHVNFSVDQNTTTSSRIGTITIGGLTFTANQAGLSVAPSVPTVTLRDPSGAIHLSVYPASTLSNSGGVFSSDPSSAQDTAGNTFVTARDGFNAIWANVYNATSNSWNGWTFGGGVIQGMPAIAVDTSGKGWIASRDSYGAYWLVSFTRGAGFGAWMPLGGAFAADPSIASCPDGSFYLIGKDNYSAIWSAHYIAGSGLQSFQLGGGVVQGKPAVSCGSDSAAYIVARDNYNSNWVARVSGNTWTGWYNGGAVTNIDPAIAALGGSMAIAILDATGAVYRTTFYEGFSNGWLPWTSVGGVLSDISPAAVAGELFLAGRAPNNDLWWWTQSGNQWTWIGNNGVDAGQLSAAPR